MVQQKERDGEEEQKAVRSKIGSAVVWLHNIEVTEPIQETLLGKSRLSRCIQIILNGELFPQCSDNVKEDVDFE